MIISKEYKFIFVSIGKTGTASMESVLLPFDDVKITLKFKRHAPISELEGQLDLNKFYKFCFVRNPWDLVVSKYFWHKRPKNLSNTHFKRWIRGNETAKRYAYTDKNLSNLNVQYEYPLRDMHDCMLALDGKRILMDDVFFFEDIKGNFEKAMMNIGLKNTRLPHGNKNNYCGNYNSYIQIYDNESMEIVFSHFKRDIKLFNYKF